MPATPNPEWQPPHFEAPPAAAQLLHGDRSGWIRVQVLAVPTAGPDAAAGHWPRSLAGNNPSPSGQEKQQARRGASAPLEPWLRTSDSVDSIELQQGGHEERGGSSDGSGGGGGSGSGGGGGGPVGSAGKRQKPPWAPGSDASPSSASKASSRDGSSPGKGSRRSGSSTLLPAGSMPPVHRLQHAFSDASDGVGGGSCSGSPNGEPAPLAAAAPAAAQASEPHADLAPSSAPAALLSPFAQAAGVGGPEGDSGDNSDYETASEEGSGGLGLLASPDRANSASPGCLRWAPQPVTCICINFKVSPAADCSSRRIAPSGRPALESRPVVLNALHSKQAPLRRRFLSGACRPLSPGGPRSLRQRARSLDGAHSARHGALPTLAEVPGVEGHHGDHGGGGGGGGMHTRTLLSLELNLNELEYVGERLHNLTGDLNATECAAAFAPPIAECPHLWRLPVLSSNTGHPHPCRTLTCVV